MEKRGRCPDIPGGVCGRVCGGADCLNFRCIINRRTSDEKSKTITKWLEPDKCNDNARLTSELFKLNLLILLTAAGYKLCRMIGKGGFCSAWEIEKEVSIPEVDNVVVGTKLVARISVDSNIASIDKYGEDFVENLLKINPRVQCVLPEYLKIMWPRGNLIRIATSTRVQSINGTLSFVDQECLYRIVLMPIYNTFPCRSIPSDCLQKIQMLITALHANGCCTVHGDLKAENILWDSSTGYPIVNDWDFTFPDYKDMRLAVNPLQYPSILQEVKINENWSSRTMDIEEFWLNWYVHVMMEYNNSDLKNKVSTAIREMRLVMRSNCILNKDEVRSKFVSALKLLENFVERFSVTIFDIQRTDMDHCRPWDDMRYMNTLNNNYIMMFEKK